tara:strand:+ start:341 stop:538 length:198 start_codon:yes stop_codon:yes gene_type:complete
VKLTAFSDFSRSALLRYSRLYDVSAPLVPLPYKPSIGDFYRCNFLRLNHIRSLLDLDNSIKAAFK